MNVNKVILAGNLTKDITTRTTQGGSVVGKTSLAVNRKWTQNGEQKESTCFVDLTFFGRLAEVVSGHLAKGDPIYIEGRLEFERWESDDGPRSKHSVIVDNFQFVGPPRDKKSKGDEEEEEEEEKPKKRKVAATTPKKPKPAEGEEDEADYGEIPF